MHLSGRDLFQAYWKIMYISITIVIMFGATARANDKIAILFKSKANCRQYQETRDGLNGSLIVQNMAGLHCHWNMRQLRHLEKEAVVYNTNNMACEGGPVVFPINDDDKSLRKDYCNQSKCVVFIKRRAGCDNAELQEVIPKLFPDCQEFDTYLKPTPFEITTSKETAGFRLEYKLLDCEGGQTNTTGNDRDAVTVNKITPETNPARPTLITTTITDGTTSTTMTTTTTTTTTAGGITTDITATGTTSGLIQINSTASSVNTTHLQPSTTHGLHKTTTASILPMDKNATGIPNEMTSSSESMDKNATKTPTQINVTATTTTSVNKDMTPSSVNITLSQPTTTTETPSEIETTSYKRVPMTNGPTASSITPSTQSQPITTPGQSNETTSKSMVLDKNATKTPSEIETTSYKRVPMTNGPTASSITPSTQSQPITTPGQSNETTSESMVLDKNATTEVTMVPTTGTQGETANSTEKSQDFETAEATMTPNSETQSPSATPTSITRETKEPRDMFIAKQENNSRPEAWTYILPIVLLALITVAICIAYFLYRKKRTGRLRKDEHISTIAL